MALWKKNRRVYGARKLHKAARRGGIDVGRDQVATVMRKAGISGVKRGKKRRTTWTDETAERPVGPGRSQVQRAHTEPSVGCRYDLCAHLVGLCVRGLRHRCLFQVV